MTLEQYIKRTQLSRTQIAALLKTTEATVSRYITGARFPRAYMLDRIFKVTGGKVTANDFLPLRRK